MSDNLELNNLIVKNALLNKGDTKFNQPLYIEKDDKSKFVYLEPNGNITCNAINLLPNGTITGIENKFSNTTVVYNPNTYSLSYVNNNDRETISNLSNMDLVFNKSTYKQTYSIPISGQWFCICMSKDATYQLACQNNNNGRVFLSTDSGITWNPVDQIDIGIFYSVSMSDSGQYQGAVMYGGAIYTSSDYGVTWNKLFRLVYNWWTIAISGNGQYQTAVSYDDDLNLGGFIYGSTDYGITWNDITPDLLVPFWFWSNSISETGQYQTAIITSDSTQSNVFYPSSIYTSSDYGTTWKYQQVGLNLVQTSMSSDGKYQLAVDLNPGIWKSSDYGATWTFINNQNNWSGSALSSDGQYQVCVSKSNIIYKSSDYGNTWNSTTFSYPISSVAISGDGSKLSLVVSNWKIYNSDDYGNTWTDNNNSPVNNEIINIACSSNAKYLASVIINGPIILSNNYGNTWTTYGDNYTWTAIGISSTGQYISAANSDGFLNISSDYGVTWKKISKSTNNVSNLLISQTGQYQAYSEYPGYIYVSNDYGNTFSQRTNIYGYYFIGMSSNGQYISATDRLGSTFSGGFIYVSEDYGITFNEIPNTNGNQWFSISMSANGKYQLAVTDLTSYWTSVDYGNTWNKGTTQIIGNIHYSVVSSTGQYQLLTKIAPTIVNYYSDDWGKSFNVLSTPNKFSIRSISSTGQYQLYLSENSIFIGFTDQKLLL